uniref:FAT domain-containing protein n=1 Tax=Macrostomum lignano TaxID=282301 RepID=A0A1I8HQP4_9PLAT
KIIFRNQIQIINMHKQAKLTVPTEPVAFNQVGFNNNSALNSTINLARFLTTDSSRDATDDKQPDELVSKDYHCHLQHQQQQNWRVLPWRDASEFIEVASLAELAPLETQPQALADLCTRLAVWLARLEQHQLPRAVLATAELAEALLLGERQSMANAGQRFVSLLAGEEETRTKQMAYTVPVTKVAASMGIPDWLVQIRHDVCHGLLPQAPLLADACREALLWLSNNFWLPQAKRCSSSISMLQRSSSLASSAQPPLSVRRFLRLQLSPSSAENSTALNAHLDGVKARRLAASEVENRRWIRGLLLAMTGGDGSATIDALAAFWLPMIGVLKKCNLVPKLMEETLLAAAAVADDGNGASQPASELLL